MFSAFMWLFLTFPFPHVDGYTTSRTLLHIVRYGLAFVRYLVMISITFERRKYSFANGAGKLSFFLVRNRMTYFTVGTFKLTLMVIFIPIITLQALRTVILYS